MRPRSYKLTGKVVPPTAGPVPPATWNRGNSHILRSRRGPAYSNCVLSRAAATAALRHYPHAHPSHSIICSGHVPTSHLPLFHPFFQLPFLFLQCCRSMASVDRTCAKRQPERTAVTSGENMGRERFCFWGRPSL
jgi:hypothetical protein